MMCTRVIDCPSETELTLFSRGAASGFYLTNTASFITLKWIFGFCLSASVAPLSYCKQKSAKYTLRYGIGVIGFSDAYKDCPLQSLLKCGYL